MWIDTRDCVPFIDGEYMVQTINGRVTSMNYTSEAGWNTHYDNDGKLCKDNAVIGTYVVRWLDAPKPKAIPKEWVDEFYEEYRKVVNKCGTE